MTATDDYLAPEECIVGNAYLISSRNLAIGVWRGDATGGFIGLREKFGDIYLFTENHWDLGGVNGTVRPRADLGPCPVQPLTESLGTVCYTCGRTARYERFDAPREVAGRLVPGRWDHVVDGEEVDGGSCGEMRPTSVPNRELHAWLEAVEAEHRR